MESREDKLIALIVLLSACLITVVFLFAVTWLNVVADQVQLALERGVAMEGISIYPVVEYPA
ncbi:MAG: hypothetical protein E7B29_21000, partial [Mixta calida]|nr:hypothetical protein [Mixta calida]